MTDFRTAVTSGQPAEWPADPLLAMFLRIIERSDDSMSFTLNVPGATVSGEVISFRTYMSIYNELFAVSSPIEIEPYAEGVAIEAIPAPQFIHMRNARVITGNTLIPDTGMLWRGRVADVSGFAYGGLAPAKR